jgi:hypothetical protein
MLLDDFTAVFAAAVIVPSILFIVNCSICKVKVTCPGSVRLRVLLHFKVSLSIHLCFVPGSHLDYRLQRILSLNLLQ